MKQKAIKNHHVVNRSSEQELIRVSKTLLHLLFVRNCHVKLFGWTVLHMKTLSSNIQLSFYFRRAIKNFGFQFFNEPLKRLRWQDLSYYNNSFGNLRHAPLILHPKLIKIHAIFRFLKDFLAKLLRKRN